MIISKPLNTKVIALLLLSFLFSCSATAKSTIFISPVGNDQNPGNKRNPIQTIEEGFRRVEKMREAGECGEIVIRLMAGTYYVKNTVVLKESLYSNTQIVGEGANKTFISGGKVVSGLVEKKDDYCIINLNGINLKDNRIPQLFINGNRKTLARTPNENFFFTPEEYEWKPNKSDGKSGIVDFKIPMDAAEALKDVDNINDVIVSFLHEWCETRRYINNYNSASKIVSIIDPILRTKQYFTRNGAKQFFLENDCHFIDEPGEYCYSSEDKCFYYLPEDGEDLTEATIIVPENRTLFSITGTKDNPIQNLRFKGISFEYTNYTMSDEGEEPYQASSKARAAVMVDYAKGVSFENCEFCHLGEYAVWFREGCDNSYVRHSCLHDLGAGAIKIGITYSPLPKDMNYKITRNVVIDNNIITGGGKILFPSVGIALFQACDCSITHNEVSDFYYSGISVGWTWGYADSPAKRNKISYNHVHHLGWGALGDMGGIYTLGASEGSTISHNVIHHLSSLGNKAWGIYLDEGSSDILVKNNVVFECKTSPFFLHYGKENRVQNNLFVTKNPINIAKVEDHVSLFLYNNLIFNTSEHSFFGKSWEVSNVKSSDNQLLRTDKWSDATFKIIKRTKAGVYGRKQWINRASANQDREKLFETLTR